MKKIIYILLVLGIMAGCRFRDDLFVDFTDIDGTQDLPFRVIGQRETDLSYGLPENCYLPDGTPINDAFIDDDVFEESTKGNAPKQTNSITAASLVQKLLKYGNQNHIIEIVGTYESTDDDGNKVTLSGKVMLPKKENPKRMILVSHYTIGSNSEAPSNCFSLEGVLVKLGYGLIIPDYMGYGITASNVHPYLVMNQTARNVLDMYLAVRPWLKAVGIEPLKDDIDLMGYSQGGATTMAVEYLIETDYSNLANEENIKIHRVFAGGGPYDVKATYERFVNTDTAGYPVAIPLVLQGMIRGNKLKVKMDDMMQPWLCDKVDEWINSKRYTTAQINNMINTHVTHEMLTQESMTQTSDNVAELYKAMTINSITSYNWTPQASVYILHSMDDETVPYTNASNAKSVWRDANIIYNFGHYGSHVKTCLRFIYSVQTLLQEEEKERQKYEE